MGTAACNHEQELKDIFAGRPEVAALAAAAGSGDIYEIDRLVGLGTDVNYLGKGNISPLLWALLRENKRGFEQMLEVGARADLLRNGMRSTLDIIALNPDSDYLRMALAHGANPNTVNDWNFQTPIFETLEDSLIENMNMLIDAGADINFQNRAGTTPLIFAAGQNHYHVAFILLKSGADFRIRENTGNTVVYSIENNTFVESLDTGGWRAKVVEFLRERGVEVSPKYSD